eukprot:ANDGO_00867.mRNA.1 hypothetical protein
MVDKLLASSPHFTLLREVKIKSPCFVSEVVDYDSWLAVQAADLASLQTFVAAEFEKVHHDRNLDVWETRHKAHVDVGDFEAFSKEEYCARTPTPKLTFSDFVQSQKRCMKRMNEHQGLSVHDHHAYSSTSPFESVKKQKDRNIRMKNLAPWGDEDDLKEVQEDHQTIRQLEYWDLCDAQERAIQMVLTEWDITTPEIPAPRRITANKRSNKKGKCSIQ